jgi:hypothetical protein
MHRTPAQGGNAGVSTPPNSPLQPTTILAARYALARMAAAERNVSQMKTRLKVSSRSGDMRGIPARSTCEGRALPYRRNAPLGMAFLVGANPRLWQSRPGSLFCFASRNRAASFLRGATIGPNAFPMRCSSGGTRLLAGNCCENHTHLATHWSSSPRQIRSFPSRWARR